MSMKLAVAIVTALAAMACGGPTDPSKNKTVVFEGTLQPQSASEVHRFEISNTGELLITVNAVTPGNVFLGLGYGQLQGDNCGLIQQTAVGNTNIGRTAISGQIFVKGTYCLVMFDPSGSLGIAPLPVAQNYRVTVSHP